MRGAARGRGPSQVWGPDVEEGLPLDYAAALGAMRAHVATGARVAVRRGDLVRLPDPRAAAARCPAATTSSSPCPSWPRSPPSTASRSRRQEADLDEWDAFESGFTARSGPWLADAPRRPPGRRGGRGRRAPSGAAYLEGYRGVLGFAYLRLLAV